MEKAMFFGIGWCVLRSSQAEYERATFDTVDAIDTRVDAADAHLWREFRAWMTGNETSMLLWTLHEHQNNVSGILKFSVSRNHSSPELWSMIDWIVANGPGSYGLVYVHDDEDYGFHRKGKFDASGRDFTNVFRVHRIMNGRVDELDDPFFGDIVPNLDFPIRCE